MLLQTLVVTYVAYVLIPGKHYLDPKTAFVAIALFDVLRFAMNYLPTIVTELIKVRTLIDFHLFKLSLAKLDS